MRIRVRLIPHTADDERIGPIRFKPQCKAVTLMPLRAANVLVAPLCSGAQAPADTKLIAETDTSLQ
jgi:hypothetical protein